MIESFKLVEMYGDEGGASMLAGAISKALITTATGLVLAIPAVILYQVFKHRVHNLGTRLEAQVETVFNEWFVAGKGQAVGYHYGSPESASTKAPHPVKPGAVVEPAATGDKG